MFVIAQVTSAQQLSPLTSDLVKRLAAENESLKITGYFSPTAPPGYADSIRTARGLLNAIAGLEIAGVEVSISDIEPYSQLASEAYALQNVSPLTLQKSVAGVLPGRFVFSSVVIKSDNDRVVVGPFGLGERVEYELVIHLHKFLHDKSRDTIALVHPDTNDERGPSAKLAKGFTEALGSRYKIESFGEPSKRPSALVVFRPSQLRHTDVERVVNAIKSGVPTAIFVDALWTADPGSMMKQPVPANNLSQLWELAQLKPQYDSVVWHRYRPQIKGVDTTQFPKEYTFISDSMTIEGNDYTGFLNDHEVTTGLKKVLFLGATHIIPSPGPLKTKHLVQTSPLSGVVAVAEAKRRIRSNTVRDDKPEKSDPRVLVAESRGKTGKGEDIHVVMVSDIDCFSPNFIDLSRDESNIVDNYYLLTNIIDTLAGVEGFANLQTKRTAIPSPSNAELMVEKKLREVEQRYQMMSDVEQEKTETEMRKKAQQISKLKGNDSRKAQVAIYELQQKMSLQLEAKFREFDLKRSAEVRVIEFERAQQKPVVVSTK